MIIKAIKNLLVCVAMLSALSCSDEEDTKETLPRSDAGVRAEDCDVPAESGALITYLTSGAYTSFESESAAHKSTGPHGTLVKTYVDPILFASLTANNAEHPVCSAVIKELLSDDGAVEGWAVAVKVREKSGQGEGFYWFETFSADPDAKPDFDGDGIILCADCHRSGRDYIRIPFPLQ